MKKTLALLLALLMLFSLAACGTAEPTPAPAVTEQPAATEAPVEAPAEEPAAETVIFTDSSGREIELPANITKIAPGGTVATAPPTVQFAALVQQASCAPVHV